VFVVCANRSKSRMYCRVSPIILGLSSFSGRLWEATTARGFSDSVLSSAAIHSCRFYCPWVQLRFAEKCPSPLQSGHLFEVSTSRAWTPTYGNVETVTTVRLRPKGTPLILKVMASGNAWQHVAITFTRSLRLWTRPPAPKKRTVPPPGRTVPPHTAHTL
jgi:hypothetical protein